MFRAGAARHTIRIEVRSSTQDAAGEQVYAWTTYATTRAAMQRATGTEVLAAAERDGRIPVTFRIRYRAGITPAMRIVCDTKVFDIKSVVDVDGRGEELVILTEEHVDETAGEDGGPYVPPVTTVDAEDVDVAAITGLAASDAQAAFAEHQGDLDALDLRVDALEATDLLLDGRLDSAEGDIAALEAADTALDARLDAVEATAANAVLMTGAQTVAGIKTFSDDVYLGASKLIRWNGTYGFAQSGTTVYAHGPTGLNGANFSAANVAAAAGNLTAPAGAVVVKTDAEVTDAGKGLILKAPNGTRYRITVSNAGALVVTAV